MQSKSDDLVSFESKGKERLFYIKINSRFKDLRKKLKKPLGMLIPLEHPQSTEYLKEVIELLKPPRIIAIGDRINSYLIELGIKPDLAIIDKKVERKAFDFLDFSKFFEYKVKVENPPGKIKKSAYEEIKMAFRHRKALVEVEGEEDLLTLVAIKESEINSLVLYGIPKLGCVAVICTKNKKDFVDKIILLSMYGRQQN